MISWVDDRLEQWGKWSRGWGENLGYPKKTVIYKLMKLGAIGTTIRVKQALHHIEMPIDVEEVEWAIIRLPINLQTTVKTKYIQPGTDTQKSKDLNITLSHFQRELEWAHQMLSTQLTNQ